MPLRTHPMPPRSALSFLKPFRFRTKKNLANLRFTLQKSGTIPTCTLFVLLVPFLLTIIFFRRAVDIAATPYLHRKSLTIRSSTYASETSTQPFIDPCTQAVPQPLIHFDPSSRASSEFNHPVTADVDPPALTRVFTTFFKIYLFEPTSDIVANLSATGRGRPTDVRDSLVHSQRALRTFYGDRSIVVHNYTLGYSHLDRVRGSRYIFHLDSSSTSNPRRRDVAAIQRTFDGRCYISVKEFEGRVFKDPVYMVVPYSNRPARLKWFLKQFDHLRAGKVLVRLILAVCKDMQTDISVANRLVESMKYSKDVRVLAVPGDRTGFFSRAVSIREGSEVVPKDSIMFIADVDMYIFPTMFDSCRYNSIQNSQVYFPVFYSLYARSSRIDKDAGYWRDSSHGMSCMYKSDFDAVGTYAGAESRFMGWGGEDVALSQAFLNHSQYEVFRAVEPALRHKWHMKHCEPLTSSYDDCVAISFQQLGTLATVGRFLLGKKIDVQGLFAEYADEDDGGSQPLISQERSSASDGQTGMDNEKLKRRQELLRRNHELLKKRRALRANSVGQE